MLCWKNRALGLENRVLGNGKHSKMWRGDRRRGKSLGRLLFGFVYKFVTLASMVVVSGCLQPLGPWAPWGSLGRIPSRASFPAPLPLAMLTSASWTPGSFHSLHPMQALPFLSLCAHTLPYPLPIPPTCSPFLHFIPISPFYSPSLTSTRLLKDEQRQVRKPRHCDTQKKPLWRLELLKHMIGKKVSEQDEFHPWCPAPWKCWGKSNELHK